MKVQVLKAFIHGAGRYSPEMDPVDVSESQAREWLAKGLVREVRAVAPSKAKVDAPAKAKSSKKASKKSASKKGAKGTK